MNDDEFASHCDKDGECGESVRLITELFKQVSSSEFEQIMKMRAMTFALRARKSERGAKKQLRKKQLRKKQLRKKLPGDPLLSVPQQMTIPLPMTMELKQLRKKLTHPPWRKSPRKPTSQRTTHSGPLCPR